MQRNRSVCRRTVRQSALDSIQHTVIWVSTPNLDCWNRITIIPYVCLSTKRHLQISNVNRLSIFINKSVTFTTLTIRSYVLPLNHSTFGGEHVYRSLLGTDTVEGNRSYRSFQVENNNGYWFYRVRTGELDKFGFITVFQTSRQNLKINYYKYIITFFPFIYF